MASTATRMGRSKLRSRSSERLDLAPAVRLAGRAHAVRLLRLMAHGALVDARRLQPMRRPPLVAAGLGLSAFRNCHGLARSIARPLFSTASGFTQSLPPRSPRLGGLPTP